MVSGNSPLGKNPAAGMPAGKRSAGKRSGTVIKPTRRRHPADRNTFPACVAWRRSAMIRVRDFLVRGDIPEAIHTINKYVQPRLAYEHLDFWNAILRAATDDEMLMLAMDVRKEVFLSNGPPCPCVLSFD